MAKKFEEKESMVLYFEWLDNLSMLNDADAMAVLRAVRSYVQTGEMPELRGAAAMAFAFMRAQVERDLEKWETEKERRSAAGKAGAAVTNQKRQKSAKAGSAENESAKDGTAEYETAKDDSAEYESANSAVYVNEHEHADVHVHVHEEEYERWLMAPFQRHIVPGGELKC